MSQTFLDFFVVLSKDWLFSCFLSWCFVSFPSFYVFCLFCWYIICFIVSLFDTLIVLLFCAFICALQNRLLYIKQSTLFVWNLSIFIVFFFVCLFSCFVVFLKSKIRRAGVVFSPALGRDAPGRAGMGNIKMWEVIRGV